jgi:hypothetical protein
MIETVISAIILAKCKHYKIRYLFFTWSFYPILLSQCILIFFQISIFDGKYYFIQFASIIKTAIILSFIFPLFVFKLYKPALIGSGFIFFGTFLNKFIITQNNGKMPVFPSLSYLTGYAKPNMFGSVDAIHVLGNEAVKYKILTDYIDLGYSILSPGDVFIHLFIFIMLYYTIKAVNFYYTAKD